jgi:2-polyprenyl-3-methyl-5-hydroxy-6-metoxy-1,4-benzoquinol methylase
MQTVPKRRVAASYLPSHYHYWYSVSKLATDPLYEGVQAALADDRSPLLDIGCGIGLLLHSLRASGYTQPYLGVDSDAAKIEIARNACRRGSLRDARFEVCDLTRAFPRHTGSVAVLDVLQYLEPAAQEKLIGKVAGAVAAEGRLIIRGGLADGSWRAALTRCTDRLGHAVGWMSTSFKSQPTRDELVTVLARHGLHAQFRPLWGRTPFNNWLVIATRSETVAARPGPVIVAAAGGG